jgi:CIC family chloride channel protein
VFGRHLGLRPEKVKELLPVGASAAIAAAFNTPMAAVLFALEEVMGDLHAPILGSVVLASATSWAVLRALLGNNPLFKVPPYELVHPLEFGIYAILGILGGFLSVAFTRLLLVMRRRFLLLPKRTAWWHPVVGGIVVGLMGWLVPQALGVGYTYVGDALNGTMAFKLMLVLVVLKLVGVTTSYASGNAGGIFGPSLFLGAMFGGAVGSVAHHLMPSYTASSGAYALVGMGALFAGIVRAPMTSVLMIFEMTRDYAVIVPLMTANLASLFISAHFQREPIYEALARQDGIHLPSRKARQEGSQQKVIHVMRGVTETLPALISAREALERSRLSRFHSWPVMDEDGIVGVLTQAKLESTVEHGKGEEKLIDLLECLDFPHVHADHELHLALARMRVADVDILPVTDRADSHKLEGVVTLHDVLAFYGPATFHNESC